MKSDITVNNKSSKKNSYDDIPYESHSFPQTHPNRLATIGQLFGLQTPSITECRVLELGCASGTNIIPMASNLPNSEFVGLDLSKRQTDLANKTINAIGLKNIRIQHASILDVNEAWGLFDYIICHGVYSWVPAQVQDKILSISSNNLSKKGIAYISYNTYPGWHMRENIRHMMLYHVNQFEEPAKRIEQGRALVEFLASSVPIQNNPYGMLLKSELELISRSNDSYLFHEHLEENNAPLYFSQFVERTDKHNLQYLGEADIAVMLANEFPQSVNETLNRISPDIIRSEQYMDFLRNRHFRQTLLCHKDHALQREITAENIASLYVASAAANSNETIDLTSNEKQSFYTIAGQNVETKFPLTKAAFSILQAHWPKSIRVEDLIQMAASRIDLSVTDSEFSQHRQTLLDDLLYCFIARTLEFNIWQADFVTEVSEKPLVSKLVHHQNNHNQPIVNQRHETVNLDFVGKSLCKMLDGKNDKNALLKQLSNLVNEGELTLKEGDVKITDEKKQDAVLQDILDKTLKVFSKVALLAE